MPEITDSKYLVTARLCIGCGGARDVAYAYTTNQGKRSVRYDSRCKACNSARRKAQRAKDPERQRNLCRSWQARNKERVAQYNRARQEGPAHRANKAYHQRLRKARIRSGQPDGEAVRAIYRRAKEEEAVAACCPVFDLPELGHEFQVDHIIPLARGGKHIASNLQVLPKGLNMRKGVSLSCQR